ncbi:MAG: phage major capsid protein [Phycicoccus sp.]
MSDTKTLIDAARVELKSHNAEVERLASTFKVDEKGRFDIAVEQFKDYQAAVGKAQEAKSAIDAFEAAQALREYGDAPDSPSVAASDAGAHGAQAALEGKSLADLFIDSDAFQRSKATGFETPQISTTIEGKSIFNFAAGTATVQSLGSAQHTGISEQAKRQWHIRDLFPKSTTQAAVLYGVRETGWVNNAAQVKQRYAADGVAPATGGPTDVYGRAPKSKLNLTTVLFPVCEITHTLDAHKNILADESRLRTFINTRAVDGVKYAEDYDLLHSVGSGEQITGLFNTPGIQSYTGLAADKHSVQVRRAITKALLAEYNPTGLVVSPEMFEQLEVEEDNTGAFRVAVSVALGAEKRVWRLSVVETTAMSNTRYLIGAFGLGAQLHDRESVSVKVSTENADNFERGVVTFRAQERVALEVPRPESFVVGTWTQPTP